MKKTILTLIVLMVTAALCAQIPQKMTYQAVVRDADDNLLTEHLVGMKISILQGSETGTAVFVERHLPTTNTNGLATIEIGDGTLVSGSFAGIDWAGGPYFIKTETDLNGGTDYTLTGTNQLLSVPYALHAKTADEFAETDPVFDGSPASDIDVEDIDNWNETHSWGDHADEGYLTEYIVTEDDVTAHQGALQITESQITDLGNYIETEIDPTVPTGTQIGEMQYWDGSEWITVAPGNTGQVLTFINGVPTWGPQLGVNDVQNPTTGKIWMNRNLGASQVATSSTDAAAYGHLYQWGRATDGHQSRTSGTTTILSSSDTPMHGLFILPPDSPNDWRSPQNDDLWQGVNGINNPCPGGYRLPTSPEWQAERSSWSSNDAAGAFASPLKLTLAGIRSYASGLLISVGSKGRYWSSTVNGENSQYLSFIIDNAYLSYHFRALGHSVRCIKD